MKRITSLFCTLVALLFLASVSVGQAAYPERTITMIVAFGAGGSADAMARSFGDMLSKELGVTIIVKNVVGAAGTIGNAELHRSKPDGYTLAYHPMGIMVSQPNLRKLPYGWDEFTPIAMITNNPMVLVTPKNLPWKTFQEAHDNLKANPDKYMFVSSSPGGIAHIAQEAIFRTLGLEITHLPTKDGASAAQALVSGTAQFFCDPPILINQFDLIGLAVMSEERSLACPTVPTFRELGFPQVPLMTIWQGVFAPRGLPQDVLQKLEEASAKIVKSKEFKELCDRVGMIADFEGSQEFTQRFHTDYSLFDEILRKSSLKQ